ncbi:MAG: hypothetical protein RBR53_04725 [Desulforegulaceae bacterium]|nr:hypothetical protein [Desulforegulaceae bacterium]
MLFSRTAVEAGKDARKKKSGKKEVCYFEWYEKAEKETCTAAKKAAGLC